MSAVLPQRPVCGTCGRFGGLRRGFRGESGPNARPMHPDWVRSLRDQCAAAGVPLHFKQWGEWAPERTGAASDSYRPS